MPTFLGSQVHDDCFKGLFQKKGVVPGSQQWEWNIHSEQYSFGCRFRSIC